MKSLTCWKVFNLTTNDNQTSTVVVGYNPESGGVIEVVNNSASGQINEYKLYGGPNDHFVGFQELWTNYCTANNVNNITDVSDQYI